MEFNTNVLYEYSVPSNVLRTLLSFNLGANAMRNHYYDHFLKEEEELANVLGLVGGRGHIGTQVYLTKKPLLLRVLLNHHPIHPVVL